MGLIQRWYIPALFLFLRSVVRSPLCPLLHRIINLPVCYRKSHKNFSNQSLGLFSPVWNKHSLGWRKEKCSHMVPHALGQNVHLSTALDFSTVLFFNIPLKTCRFLSRQSRVLAIWGTYTLSKTQGFGYQSWEQCRSLAWDELLLRRLIAYSGSRSDSRLSLTDTLCNNIP